MNNRVSFIDEVNPLQAKRVLLRVGFDVSLSDLDNEQISWRIRQGIETIEFLLAKGAKVLLLNHIDRPHGVFTPELSNARVAKIIGSILKQEIPCLPIKEGLNPWDSGHDLLILENLRFFSEEEANDEGFARRLASLGEIYVNDAFSNCHRAHASMVGIPKFLPSYGGLLLKKELTGLEEARLHKEEPLVLIIGGVKIETKLQAIKYFWDKAQAMILGGTLANAFLQCQGIAIGKSVIPSKEMQILQNFPLTAGKIYLPIDVRTSRDKTGSEGIMIRPVGNIKEDEIILDIGPDSETLFDNIIRYAKIIIWNGPIGMFEEPLFAQGTIALAHSLQESNAKVFIGGGQTIEFLQKNHLVKETFFLSTGGGAMLSYLAGEELPALKALLKSPRNVGAG